MPTKLSPDMKRMIEEHRLAFVATVCPDGTPNVSPKGTTAVWDDDHLVFAVIRSPVTSANLQKNPSVELNVVDVFSRKGYRFKGTGEVITAGERFEEIMKFYGGRWAASATTRTKFAIRAFVLVKVERALPLTSPAYDDGTLDEESIRKHYVEYFDRLNRR
jgi:predicted pyridoxine 5'-phosphate oxidase superfamily flavin-nucleotide-binding protein